MGSILWSRKGIRLAECDFPVVDPCRLLPSCPARSQYLLHHLPRDQGETGLPVVLRFSCLKMGVTFSLFQKPRYCEIKSCGVVSTASTFLTFSLCVLKKSHICFNFVHFHSPFHMLFPSTVRHTGVTEVMGLRRLLWFWCLPLWLAGMRSSPAGQPCSHQPYSLP